MEYPYKEGKPTKGMANKVGPDGCGCSKTNKMEKNLFTTGANQIPTTAEFAKKGKGATVNKSVVKSKPNQISPHGKY